MTVSVLILAMLISCNGSGSHRSPEPSSLSFGSPTSACNGVG